MSSNNIQIQLEFYFKFYIFAGPKQDSQGLICLWSWFHQAVTWKGERAARKGIVHTAVVHRVPGLCQCLLVQK